MLRSMTGFGEASGQSEGIHYVVEVKTVNNRYLKTSLRLTDTIAFCEEDIERTIRSQISRGTVNLTVRMQNISGPALFDVDENALNHYLLKVRHANRGHQENQPVNPADLLSLPGVIVPVLPDPDQEERIRQTVISYTETALEKLKDMRLREGENLRDDLLSQLEVIEQKLKTIRTKSPQVVQEYHEKLAKRVDELLAGAKLKLDADTLAREVAIFADRSDIAEELTRLESHLGQFRNCCKKQDNAGRRLDFISQEMLREANTIGSKASDSEICALVIDIKCAIDRIKEQVQNVE